MPSDPERPIEKLLRRAAQKRRERAGDGWKIHPATRRVWQGEAGRRWGRKHAAKSSWFSWLPRSGWLKTAGACAVILIVVGLGFLMTSRPRHNARQLARNEPSRFSEAERSGLRQQDNTAQQASEVKVSDAPKQLLADNSPTAAERDKSAMAQRPALLANNTQPESRLDRETTVAATPGPSAKTEPAPSPAPPSSSALAANDAAPFAQRYGLARGLAPQTQTAAGLQGGGDKNLLVTPPAENAAQARSNERMLVPQNQPELSLNSNLVEYGRFQASQTFESNPLESEQLNRRNSVTPASALALQQAPALNHILVSFQIEQAGQELRVIDSDGSVYRGAIQITNLPRDARLQTALKASDALLSAKSKAKAGRVLQNVTPSAASAFEVLGTNRTSNQKVFFSGIIRSETKPGSFVDNQAFVAGRIAAQKPSSNSPNFSLSGTALIEGGQKIRIEAAPVQP